MDPSDVRGRIGGTGARVEGVRTATTTADLHADIRAGVRDLCGRFPPEYFRRIDEARGYPEEFVEF